eukprot:1738712-Pyramimonas_sp.AAC.1
MLLVGSFVHRYFWPRHVWMVGWQYIKYEALLERGLRKHILLRTNARVLESEGDGTLATALQEFTEPVVILLILLINALVGLWQQGSAEKALDALKDLQCPDACVKRGGK